jgi:excinuclease ABC subunit A
MLQVNQHPHRTHGLGPIWPPTTCQGEGFAAVERVFLPGTYSPCPTCAGTRYDADALEVRWQGLTIADVLGLSVDDALGALSGLPAATRSLNALRDVGLGYVRLGQPATELSGGEAQRIKLAAELRRGSRGHTPYLLDDPATGLHPADLALLYDHLHRLVDAGNTVVVVENVMAAIESADWLNDLGPEAGHRGGQVVASGPPVAVAETPGSRTGGHLPARFAGADGSRRTAHSKPKSGMSSQRGSGGDATGSVRTPVGDEKGQREAKITSAAAI